MSSCCTAHLSCIIIIHTPPASQPPALPALLFLWKGLRVTEHRNCLFIYRKTCFALRMSLFSCGRQSGQQEDSSHPLENRKVSGGITRINIAINPPRARLLINSLALSKRQRSRQSYLTFPRPHTWAANSPKTQGCPAMRAKPIRSTTLLTTCVASGTAAVRSRPLAFIHVLV